MDLPGIKFQYFDPDSEKLKTIIYTTENRIVLSNSWEVILSIFILLIIIYAIKSLGNEWKRRKILKAKRLYAIQLLQKPENRSNTREAIRLFSETETGSLNSTLIQWKEKWSAKYKTDENFETLYHKISDTFYSDHHDINLSEINSELLKLFNGRKRLK
jgi:hypothetical protein